MKRAPHTLVLALFATILPAQQPPDPAELLTKARAQVVARAKRLPDYVCVQTVDRQYFRHAVTRSTPRDCAAIMALRRDNPRDFPLFATDRLRLEVKVSRGMEIGTWAGSSQFDSRSIFDLIGGGAYGTGALGTFLGDIFENGKATYSFIGAGGTGAAKLAAYGYQVPEDASHYQIKAGAKWVPTAFHGAFWIDPDSLDLKRLMVNATDLPAETKGCEAATTVEYDKVPVGTGEFLLPQRSSMRMVLTDATETLANSVYSGCREYHGEATIHFDAAAAENGTQATTSSTPPIPSGRSLSLALTAPIDTDTAAAGDIVTARLRKAVRISKELQAPAGATVQLRLVQMRHVLDNPSGFVLSLLAERLEWQGISLPLYASIDRTGEGFSGLLPAKWNAPLVASFAFETSKNRHIVPAGYQMNWITVPQQ